MLPAVLLMGPTASGKSALAVALAQRLGGEILSVDSAQVYRGMDVGTAKPSIAERGGVPHHLIDIVDPTEAYSAARFVRDALAAIASVRGRGRVPIVAGGHCVGAVGVSGVKSTEDAQIARAGIAALALAG